MNFDLFFSIVGWAAIIFAAPLFLINFVVGFWINFTRSGRLHQLELKVIKGEMVKVGPALFKWGIILTLGIALILSL